MRRVAQRDVTAFESIYDKHNRLVFGIALRVLADAASAEDVAQSVFLKIWANAAAFGNGSLAAWISRVTRNAALDVLRQRSGDRAHEAAADVSPEGNVENDALIGIDAHRVRCALATLPGEQRSLIEMGFFEGVTHRRLAAKTGLPLGTVKTRIRAGLRRLRQALQGEGIDAAEW